MPADRFLDHDPLQDYFEIDASGGSALKRELRPFIDQD